MTRRLIILCISIIAFSILIYLALIKFCLIDKFAFLSPIDYYGDIPIRRDDYGNGEFGAKRSGRRKHLGIDILAEIGMPVRAVKLGIVINATTDRGFGKYVEIRHGLKLVTIYAHLSKINVSKGEHVCQGQIIGEVGKTGNARNRLILPHLHFEARKKGLAQDPLNYLNLSRSKNKFKLLESIFPNNKE